MSIRILCVDADASAGRILSNEFKNAGFETMHVNSSSEAIHLARYHDFDVCLVDLQMPCLDGLELCKYLKRKMPESSFFATIESGSEMEEHNCTEVGFEGFFTKPIDVDKFFNIVYEKVNSSQEQLVSVG